MQDRAGLIPAKLPQAGGGLRDFSWGTGSNQGHASLISGVASNLPMTLVCGEVSVGEGRSECATDEHRDECRDPQRQVVD